MRLIMRRHSGQPQITSFVHLGLSDDVEAYLAQDLFPVAESVEDPVTVMGGSREVYCACCAASACRLSHRVWQYLAAIPFSLIKVNRLRREGGLQDVAPGTSNPSPGL